MVRPLAAARLGYQHAPSVQSVGSCQAQPSRTGHLEIDVSLQSRFLLTSMTRRKIRYMLLSIAVNQLPFTRCSYPDTCGTEGAETWASDRSDGGGELQSGEQGGGAVPG